IGLVRRQSPSETADPLSVARTGRVRRSFPGPALPGLPPGRPRALPFRLPAPHGLRTDRCSSRIGHRPTTPGSTRTPNRHVQPYVHQPPAPPARFGAPAPYPVHRRYHARTAADFFRIRSLGAPSRVPRPAPRIPALAGSQLQVPPWPPCRAVLSDTVLPYQRVSCAFAIVY